MLLKNIWNKLDDYQQGAVRFVAKVKTAFLLFQQGTGKTWIGSGLVEHLVEKCEAADQPFRGILIVPLTNKTTSWRKVLDDNLERCRIVSTFDSFKRASGNVLWITHYEQIPPHRKALRKMKVTLTVYDESQRIKNRTSIASRVAASLGVISEYRVAMTGTPIDKQPGELWAQFRFVKSELLGNWGSFEDRFFEPVPPFDFGKYRGKSAMLQSAYRKYRIEIGKRKFDMTKFEELMGIIRPYSLLQTDKVLGLKETRFHPVIVPMGERQSYLYNRMKRTLVAGIAGKTVTAQTRGVLVWKLHQMAGGFLIDENKKVHRIGTTKLQACIDLIDKLEGPLVIFAKYVHEIRALYNAVKDVYDVGVIYGKTKKKDRAKVQEAFQAGKLDLVILQIKTGGVGIDLFKSHKTILYSVTHSFIDFDQAIARTRRRGQTEDTEAYLLLSQGTIDETLWLLIKAKRTVTTKVIAQLVSEEKQPWLRKK